MYKLLESTIRVSLSRTPKSLGLNEKSIIILVDNVEIQTEDLMSFSPHEVESIEYLKKVSETTIFGVHGEGGVVLITTKQNKGAPTNNTYSNMKVITPLGYQITKEFYSPVYKTIEQKTNNMSDLRTTIYWNPNMITQDDGKANIHFYTSDNPEHYSVIIEGITDEGKIVYSANTFK